DLLDFCTNEKYREPKWAGNYCNNSPAPKDDAAWNACVPELQREAKALADFTINEPRDLTAKIPHGTGQTYLRTILVAVDHTSQHVGQIIAVRYLLGAWPPSYTRRTQCQPPRPRRMLALCFAPTVKSRFTFPISRSPNSS